MLSSFLVMMLHRESSNDLVALLCSATWPSVMVFVDHSGSVVLRSPIRIPFAVDGILFTMLGTSFGVLGE